MTVINIIVGCLIAVVSGLGVGGGGLFAVYLSIFTDTPQLSIQGYNLLFFLFCAGASVTVQLFRRRIPFAAVAVMILSGILGAVAGTWLAQIVPEDWLRRAFGIMLVAGGIISLKNLTSQKYSKKSSTGIQEDGEKSTENSESRNEK